MGSVVLVTGAAGYLGSRLAARLAADPAVDRVIGVDVGVPRAGARERLHGIELVRADIRNPLIAGLLTQAQVDTVAHTALNTGITLGRAAVQEQTITGTMQLLSACQRSETVRRLVVKSTTAVYGAGPRDPAVFTEAMHAVGHPAAHGYAHDAVEVENYVRGFMRRRPDIAVTVLRLANIVGLGVDTALTRYLAMPVVPSPLGFDPRLQLLHESDAVEALAVACLRGRPGVFNVAGDGVLTLSQAVRRGGRLRLPVPGPALSLMGAIVRNAGVLRVSAEQASYLNFGRVVDTTRLKRELGFTPRYTTQAALRACLTGRPATAEGA